MKKLLGILVLGLMWYNVSLSDDYGPYVAIAKHKLGDQLFSPLHMEEFLNHAVDYSMMDKIKDLWHEPKDLA